MTIEGRTLAEVLHERALAEPDRVFLRTRAGDLTLGATDAAATSLAGGLHGLGLARGSVLAVLLPNREELVLTWLGADRAGLVLAPVNTAFRGAGLAHALRLTGAATIVVDASLVGALAEVAHELPDLTTAVVVGGTGTAAPDRLRILAYDALAGAAPAPHPSDGDPLGPAMLLFTSGSTGRSKACQVSQRYLLRHAEIFAERLAITGDDVLYCPFPLFHIDAAVLTVVPALLTGAVAAIGERFSVSGFWPEVRAFDATVFDFMGATLALLDQAPPSPADRDHRVRLAWGVPMPSFAPEFEERFGLHLVELYGSTDAGVVLYPADQRVPGSCGRAIGTYDVAVRREDGTAAAAGEVGELVLRPLEPSLLADGYYADPGATLASRRDLWFHTGDLARMDRAGNVFFVGRRGDVVRRRGENIAVLEVEEGIAEHPAVAEVAVFGVASELTEQEVMAAVVLRDPGAVDAPGLWAFSQGRMARHMVPRYIALVDALPRTPTEKVERHRLAAAGVTPGTWDAEAGRVARRPIS